jgi:dTDP-4-amino-4,6-dideoxygalactose transaminase
LIQVTNVNSATAVQIPALDLKAQYQTIREEIQEAINAVLERQHFVLGPEVTALEREVADYCKRKFAVGVGSGTDALILGLKAAGVCAGDEVIVPSFTFIASADAVSMLGAKPVFVDIEPRTFNLNPARLQAAITQKTRAIIAVHLYGQTADMDPILEIAAQCGAKVIEDTAQSLGARYWGRPAASMGDLGCISFFPSKNLGAYGDGGMVVTDSEETFVRLKRLRAHGCTKKYISDELGWNSRLDELQAAILRVKLRHLEAWAVARRAKAALYTARLAPEPRITPPISARGCEHVFHQYTVRVAQRSRVQARLSEFGISSTVYYPVSLCLQPIYRELGYKPGDLPETDKACETVLSLPIYPELTDDQQEYVAEHLIRAVSEL